MQREQVKQEKAEQARREAERQARVDAEEKLKAERLAIWLQNGGDADRFEAEWPALRLEIIRQRTLAGEGQPPRDLVSEYLRKAYG